MTTTLLCKFPRDKIDFDASGKPRWLAHIIRETVKDQGGVVDAEYIEEGKRIMEVRFTSNSCGEVFFRLKFSEYIFQA